MVAHSDSIPSGCAIRSIVRAALARRCRSAADCGSAAATARAVARLNSATVWPGARPSTRACTVAASSSGRSATASARWAACR